MADDTSGTTTSTQTAFAVVAGLAAIAVAAVAVLHFFLLKQRLGVELEKLQQSIERVRKAQDEYANNRSKFKDWKSFMAHYKKRFLLSCFDFQSRLTTQINTNLLHNFIHKRGTESDLHKRDKDYAFYNYSFVFAEFLGYLEIIRQELTFAEPDDPELYCLGALLDDIKFTLTGETDLQGKAPDGTPATGPNFDEHPSIFQLYSGEIRSIGSVMLREDALGFKAVMNADEFQELMMTPEPAPGASEQAIADWNKGRAKVVKSILTPLTDSINKISELDKEHAPKKRLAILQVQLCRLIELLDSARPWDFGPKFDVAEGEEPLHIARDIRITPLVKLLSPGQRKYLAGRPYFEHADDTANIIHDPRGEWSNNTSEAWVADPSYRKLCFAGFREELAKFTQAERDTKLWPGACPPKQPRRRPLQWLQEKGFEDVAADLMAKGGSMRQRKPAQAEGGKRSMV